MLRDRRRRRWHRFIIIKILKSMVDCTQYTRARGVLWDDFRCPLLSTVVVGTLIQLSSPESLSIRPDRRFLSSSLFVFSVGLFCFDGQMALLKTVVARISLQHSKVEKERKTTITLSASDLQCSAILWEEIAQIIRYQTDFMLSVIIFGRGTLTCSRRALAPFALFVGVCMRECLMGVASF